MCNIADHFLKSFVTSAKFLNKKSILNMRTWRVHEYGEVLPVKGKCEPVISMNDENFVSTPDDEPRVIIFQRIFLSAKYAARYRLIFDWRSNGGECQSGDGVTVYYCSRAGSDLTRWNLFNLNLNNSNLS